MSIVRNSHSFRRLLSGAVLSMTALSAVASTSASALPAAERDRLPVSAGILSVAADRIPAPDEILSDAEPGRLRYSERVRPAAAPAGRRQNGVSAADPVAGADAAHSRAAELLRMLSDRIRSLGRYAAAFAVEADGQSAAGRYTVGGDSYYLRLGDAEVYGDGRVRYEVDNRRREVAVDRVDAASRNLLDNPTRAFDFVDDEFEAELLWERDGRAAVKLTPKAGAVPCVVTVALDTRTMRPMSLEYDFDGERIRIVVRSLEAVDKAPKEYDPAEYRTYETIYFR